jgi:hypothetical protein
LRRPPSMNVAKTRSSQGSVSTERGSGHPDGADDQAVVVAQSP